MDNYRLYTIGHSNQSQEEFLALLSRHGINCIVDVRSVPASKFAPQFNRDLLKHFLNQAGVQYLHFGEEFGARRTDCLDDDGKVNFEQAVLTPKFKLGVERLMEGLHKGFNISLMCSEANPLECHRFSLVARYFHDIGVDVRHILKDGNLATHQELEKLMVNEFLHSKKYRLAEVDMLFGTYTADEQLRDAYRLKNKEIGYVEQQAEEIETR